VDHEANICPWVALAKTLNLTVKWWTPCPGTNPRLTLATLESLLTQKTRLVTCTHASNILGSIHPIRAIADMVHTIPGAMLVVDGVAYVPHRPVDVKALDVDFYAFSWYKAYGPHIAQLYAKRAVQDRAMTSLGHYFQDSHTLEGKLALSGASYEMVQSLTAVVDYVGAIGWKNVVAQEAKLQDLLLGYLRSKPSIFTIYGEPSADKEVRVSVVSFGIKGKSSQDAVEKIVERSNFGIQWGHMYAKRLVEDVLGLDEGGVIRVGMLHYNTVEEVQSFVAFLDNFITGMLDGEGF
jgi:selenocysteine lyase/cysteine desulfurase